MTNSGGLDARRKVQDAHLTPGILRTNLGLLGGGGGIHLIQLN